MLVGVHDQTNALTMPGTTVIASVIVVIATIAYFVHFVKTKKS